MDDQKDNKVFRWRPSESFHARQEPGKRKRGPDSPPTETLLFRKKITTESDGSGTNKNRPRPRLRAARACKRCRTLKIKCSGQLPCDSCVKHGAHCIFTDESTGGEIRQSDLNNSTNSNSGWPRDFIANQTDYLRQIEVANTDYIIRQSSSPMGPDLHRHQNVLATEFFERVLDTLPPDKRALFSIPPPRYFGWNMLSPQSIITDTLPLPPGLELDQMKYVDYFFREVNSLYGIIHEPIFRDQLAAFNGLAVFNPDETPERFSRGTVFRATLYLIYAISIRLLDYGQGVPSSSTTSNERAAFRYGYSTINHISFEVESFELIQAWLLVTIYLRISHHQGSVYMALSRATTMTKLMGLRYEEPILENSSLYEKQRARRIFWSVFTIERVLGLHKGNYGAVNMKYIQRTFPSLNYVSEDDSWLPFPAFALLHVAKIANLVYTMDDAHKYERIDHELDTFSVWLDHNGFANSQLFNNPAKFSGLAAAQVKLHYYDLIICVHGRVLFNFLGHQVANEGPSIERVLEACSGIIEVLKQVQAANLLTVPWYNTLLLLFNVGITSLTLLNAGIYIQQSKLMLQSSIDLLTDLQQAASARVPAQESHMDKVRECLWVLRLANKALILRFEQNRSELFDIGIDHESLEREISMESSNRPGDNVYGDDFEERLLYATEPTLNMNSNNIAEDVTEHDQWLAQWMDFHSSPLQTSIAGDTDPDENLWVSQWVRFHSPTKESDLNLSFSSL